MNRPSILLEIVFILLLILINGVLALAEIALVSARKARIQARANDGSPAAKAVLELTKNPTKFLSAVQIGITLVGILAGAVSGATIGQEFGDLLGRIPGLGPYNELLGVVSVVILVSYLSLLVGELVPKRIALTDPEKYALRVARPMTYFARITSPLVRFLSFSSEQVMKLLRIKPSGEPPVTEEEIILLIEQGTRAGVFASAEQEMLGSVMRLADRTAENMLTPRTEVIWLDLDDPLDQNLKKVIETPHSRFPLARGGLDDVVGVVQTKIMMAKSLKGETINLHELVEEPIHVPETMQALKILDLFNQTQQRMAFVLDEYGGFQGLVTVNDILGAIGGDILFKERTEIPEIVTRSDGSWLVDGMLLIEDLKELLNIKSLPEEENAGYQTVGGFVMAFLGSVPKSSDAFDWQEYHFEVLDMDGLRVDKILISKLN